MKTNNSYRTIARVVGIIYLAGMVLGIGGYILIQSVLGRQDYLPLISANSLTIGIGAMLWLLTGVGDAAHGILMFPVLRNHGEVLGAGYLGFRIIDAVFIGVHVLLVLIQISIGNMYLKQGIPEPLYLRDLSTVFMKMNLYAYQIGMIFVGISGLILCYTFYLSMLVPRFLAVWGLAGYAILLFGSILESQGFDLHAMHTIPGGLWEIFTGIWLIARGFNLSTNFLTSVKTDIDQG